MGKHSAVMAGYSVARGEYIVNLDYDYQCPVNELWKLIEPLETNQCDVATASYLKKKETVVKRMGSAINLKMTESMLNKPKGLRMENFSAMKKFVYDYNPYRSAGYNQYKNFAYSAGVMMNHPNMLALYERWGIANPTKDLLLDNVYLIDTDYTDYKLNYLREHYDSNVEVEMVDTVEGYNIWKFYPKE